MQLFEALDRLLTSASPLPSERVPVWTACRRVAAADVAAPSPVPHFRRAAMDGYVCHDADLRGTSPEHPVRLRVTGAAVMGGPPGVGPGRGEAWTITTGGPVPERGDRVVPLELARAIGDVVHIAPPPSARRNVAEPGEDVRAGARLVRAGDVIGPGAAAALAASGVCQVDVHRRLRVGIVATGTELVELPEEPAPLPPGRVFNSNSVALRGELEDIGCVVDYRGIVQDEPAALRAALAALVGCYDVVITTGGVSVGRHDAVHRTWLDLGVRRIVGRVELKPGGPFFAGQLGGAWVIGLSGTPVACLAAFHLLARPVLLKLQGRRLTVRPIRVGALTTPLPSAAGRQRALWARIREPDRGDDPEVELLDGELTGNFAAVLGAGGLALIPPGTPPLPRASRVPVLMLDRDEDRDRLVVPPPEPAPAVVGVIGASGSGKTRLLSGLIRALGSSGVNAVVVKHAAHGFAIDRPGSDTARLRDAGAVVAAVTGPAEAALRLAAAGGEPERIVDLAVRAARAVSGAPPACVFMEGFSHPGRPVIQVGEPKSETEFAEVWATVPPTTAVDARRFDDEVARVAAIVMHRLLGA